LVQAFGGDGMETSYAAKACSTRRMTNEGETPRASAMSQSVVIEGEFRPRSMSEM
jgi:hypothetical protein